MLCLGIVLSPLPGHAEQDEWYALDACGKIFFDKQDSYKLGEYAIGKPMLSVMGEAGFKQFQRACEPSSEDGDPELLCGLFHDKEHAQVSYTEAPLVAENIVYLVEVSRASGYWGDLIAGIELGEDLISVTQKLAQLPTDFPTWKIRPFAQGVSLKTGPCLKSSYGITWGYHLNFDDQLRLAKIYTMIHY